MKIENKENIKYSKFKDVLPGEVLYFDHRYFLRVRDYKTSSVNAVNIEDGTPRFIGSESRVTIIDGSFVIKH